MTILLVVVGVFVLSYATLWILSRIPYRHKNLTQYRIGLVLRALLKHGREFSFVLIEVPKTEFFVQFGLRSPDGGPLTIVADFPVAPWSRPYVEGVRAQLQRSSAVVWTEPGDGDIEYFIKGDFASDIDQASEFAFKTLEQVFGVDPTQQAYAVIHHP